MSDIVLGIRLTADGKGLVGEVKLSSKEIDKLGNKTEEAGRKARKGSQGVEEFGNSAQSASLSVGTLARRMIGLIGTGFAVRELKQATDVYINANALLRVASNSTSEFTTAQTELAQIASDTRQSWESVVQVYARLALNTKDLGVSQRDLLTVTKALNQSVSVSGASSAEAGAALIQLSQGLAAGALRGDELRSVMEQLPFVARQIAKGMGISFSEFRKRSQEGKITSQAIVDAMVKQAGEIQAAFDKMPPTIDQALTQIGNALVRMVGDLGEVTGAASGAANALISVSRAITAISDAETQGIQGLLLLKDSLTADPNTQLGLALRLSDLHERLRDLQGDLKDVRGKGTIRSFLFGDKEEQAIIDAINKTATEIQRLSEKRQKLISGAKPNEAAGAPGPQPSPTGIDSSIFDKLIANAATATGQLENAFQTPFERISDRYVAMWQRLEAAQATGTAKQIAEARAAQAQLTSAYTQYLEMQEAAEAASAQRRADAAVQSASQKFAAMQQAEGDFGASEEERAINRLNRQLTAMDEERARLEEHNAFKAEIEQQWQGTRAAIIEAGTARIREIRLAEMGDAVALEANKTRSITALNQAAYTQGISLLQMYAGKSKAIALLLTALRTAEAVSGIKVAAATATAQTQAWGAAAAARALAELGPIAGPPAAAAIEAQTQALTAQIAASSALGISAAIAGGVLKGAAILKGGGGNAQPTYAASPATGLPVSAADRAASAQQQQPQPMRIDITIRSDTGYVDPLAQQKLVDELMPMIEEAAGRGRNLAIAA